MQDTGPASHVELLQYGHSVVELTNTAAFVECEQLLSASAACCLAVLLQQPGASQVYFSTLRPLAKKLATERQRTGKSDLRNLCDAASCLQSSLKSYTDVCALPHCFDDVAHDMQDGEAARVTNCQATDCLDSR